MQSVERHGITTEKPPSLLFLGHSPVWKGRGGGSEPASQETGTPEHAKWLSDAIICEDDYGVSTSELEEAFERLVCRTLRLPYWKDVDTTDAGGRYHELGVFKPAEADAAVDAAVSWYRRETQGDFFTFADYTHTCGRVETLKGLLDRLALWVDQEAEINRQHADRWQHWSGSESKAAPPQRPRHPRPGPLPTKAEIRFVGCFSRDRYTPDRRGYLTYLSDEVPALRDLLYGDIPALIREKDRLRHTLCVATPGSGKSELLKLLIHSYYTTPTGAVVVIDPANDFAKQVAQWKENLESDRLLYIDPTLAKGYTITLNPLELKNPSEGDKDIAAQEIIDAFQELIGDTFGGDLTLNMQTLLMPCLVTLFGLPGATLADLQRFMDDNSNHDLIELGRQSRRVMTRRFFEKRFLDKRYGVTKHSIYTKLQNLFEKQAFYDLVCGKSTVDLEEAIAERKIIVCNLAKGRLGRAASDAFGRLLIANLQTITMRRAELPKHKRIPIHLFVDEAHNYISRSTITILRENRKFGLHGTLCMPGLGASGNPRVLNEVVDTTNVKMVGTTPGPREQRYLGGLLGIDAEDIGRLGLGEFYVKTLEGPTFKLYTATHLLDTANRMTRPSWNRTVRRQLDRYYRRLEVEDPDAAPGTMEQGPDVERTEETVRDKTPRKRKRRLI